MEIGTLLELYLKCFLFQVRMNGAPPGLLGGNQA